MSTAIGLTEPTTRPRHADLARQLVELEAERRRLDSRILSAVAAARSQGLAESFGYRSLAVWQRDTLGIAHHVGARRIRFVAAAGRLPASLANLATGAISLEHVEEIIRFHDTIPNPIDPAEWLAAEAMLAEWAAATDPRALRRFADRELRPLLDPSGTASAEKQPTAPKNELQMRFAPDGRLEFHGALKAEVGALLARRLRLSTHPTTDRDRDHRSVVERRGDALAAWVRDDDSPRAYAHRGNRPQVTVTIDWDTLRTGLGSAALGPDGVAITASEARKLACDSNVVPTVLGSRSLPLDIGQATETVPARIWRAVARRDRGCAFPRCNTPPNRCRAHYVHPWYEGGVTDVDNLTMLCSRHHRAVHHFAWKVRMVGGRPTFESPTHLGPDRRSRADPLDQPNAA